MGGVAGAERGPDLHGSGFSQIVSFGRRDWLSVLHVSVPFLTENVPKCLLDTNQGSYGCAQSTCL